ncbi:MAG: serpin [Gammaproteobacteria bacterium]|jgi:serpin B|nr:serpin [Gammaproteobacteria bacterium]
MSQRKHKRMIEALGAFSLVTVLMAGCGGSGGSSDAMPTNPGGPLTAAPAAVMQAKEASSPVDPTIVTADNTFGLNLLNTLIQSNSGSNTAIAPLSVAIALQIAYNGAAGTTQQAMAQTLQLGNLSVPQLNGDNAALQASLLNPDPKVDLTIANSLWFHLSTNPVAAAFVSTDQNYYGAEIGDLAGAPTNVNDWVDAQTNGFISAILPTPPQVDYSTIVALLVNVIYFKGQWASEFPVAQTASGPFVLADGTQTSAPMMQQATVLPYVHGTNFQAVNLLYGQGRLSMLIVLPDTGVDLGGFVAAMTPSDIDTWVSEMSTVLTINLSLPRFTTSFSSSLKSALTTLGMGIAFEPGQGNLSGIYPGAFISDVEHKTVVQVDETGTVAAAATSVGIGTTAMQEPVNLVVNHPFFYAIRDNTTGDLLFVGVLMNPGAG